MSKMKDFFKPSDFMQRLDMEYVSKECAEIANTKLNKLIESWPVVYGHTNGAAWFVEKGKHVQEQHTARLAFIEEIKKECKHEPDSEVHGNTAITICKHCGVELQATWSEVKK